MYVAIDTCEFNFGCLDYPIVVIRVHCVDVDVQCDGFIISFNLN